jgi:hypothetical protein
MSFESEQPTAQVLDLEAFRQRRRAATPVARRPFLWVWPTGQALAVQFPAVAPAPARHRFI